MPIVYLSADFRIVEDSGNVKLERKNTELAAWEAINLGEKITVSSAVPADGNMVWCACGKWQIICVSFYNCSEADAFTNAGSVAIADAGEEPTTVVESTATLAAQTAECLTSADFVGGQDGIITAGQWLHMEAGDQDTMIVVVLNKLFE